MNWFTQMNWFSSEKRLVLSIESNKIYLLWSRSTSDIMRTGGGAVQECRGHCMWWTTDKLLVHGTTEKSDNAGLSYRPLQSVTKTELSFRKRSSNCRNLKTKAFFVFVWTDENILKRMESWLSTDLPDWIFLKHKSKITGDDCVFYTPRVVWAGP